MNTAAAAPTAPVTRTGQESQEDTMIALATAALHEVEAEIAYAMSIDDEAWDADLAARHEAAIAAVRAAAAPAQVKAVRWVVMGRMLRTRRAVKWAGDATSREDALAQARAKWAARGGALVDQVGEALR